MPIQRHGDNPDSLSRQRDFEHRKIVSHENAEHIAGDQTQRRQTTGDTPNPLLQHVAGQCAIAAYQGCVHKKDQ